MTDEHTTQDLKSQKQKQKQKKKIDETRHFFLEVIKKRNLVSKKHKKGLCYFKLH